MRWLILLLLLAIPDVHASIGDVRQQQGEGTIQRKAGDTLTSTTGTEIESYDTVRTKIGRISIEFVDDTRVDVTENSKLVIDEFIYDPNTSTGALALKASFGTVRYASGQIAKNSKQNVKIYTPTAVVGVRGTDFSMTVDETGSSTIILLPSCTIIANERVCVTGEISVESDVETRQSSPLKPLVLDLDESFINNLLIITPPEKLEEEMNKDAIQAMANLLDIDFLVFEELSTDYLAEGEADRWQTDLDFDPLAGDFLFDALDQSMDNLIRQARTDLDRKETNPKLGFDAETGVTILNQDPRWIYIREGASGNYVRMELQQGYNYSIDHNQNGNEIIGYEINPSGGSINNNITINQQN
jgi:hypothetical protein